MKVEIETHDPQLLASLTEAEEPLVGFEADIPGNASLRYSGKVQRTGIVPGMGEVLSFTLTFGSGVMASMVATWLYEKLKQKAETLRIGKTKIAVHDTDLLKRIEQCIEETARDHSDNNEASK
jgi:hypothetical protein